MKRIYTLLFLFLSVCTLSAQHTDKAKEILEKTTQTYRQAEGISIVFGGSQHGKLLLKGEKFHLITDEVETWFDGTTLWSYLKENEEVNISTPTQEELQTIHPYALISMWQNGFSYHYKGTATHKGKQAQVIMLNPSNKQDLKSITLAVSKTYEPLYIEIKAQGGHEQRFEVHSYRSHLNLHDNVFRFNTKDYPLAEIIDLR